MESALPAIKPKDPMLGILINNFANPEKKAFSYLKRTRLGVWVMGFRELA